jgi:hypothetical protein
MFFSFWTNNSDFPTNGFRCPVRCFASPFVGDEMQFTISLSSASAVWTFGMPYVLGGTMPCGDSFFATSSGIDEEDGFSLYFVGGICS